MSYSLRLARPEDADALLSIYAPYVEDTCITFELEVPSVSEFRSRIERELAAHCYIVAVDASSSKPVGYAYYGDFRERGAFRYACETSIYIAPDHQGHGLGSLLLKVLESLMREQGVRMAEACITSDNSRSILFHERHGYRICGEHHACGYKFGRWLAVTWMEKQLRPLRAEARETLDGPLQPLPRHCAENLIRRCAAGSPLVAASAKD